jgi:rubrerythrin
MDATSFAEALDFAIGREKAAVDFYRELAALASFAVQRSTLTEFMAMEEGHVAMLSAMKARGGLELSSAIAVDLGLAKALAADEKPAAGMSFQDILVAAVKKEERSGELYESLAAASLNPEAKAVFQRLVAEESRHKRYFEELYEAHIARDN